MLVGAVRGLLAGGIKSGLSRSGAPAPESAAPRAAWPASAPESQSSEWMAVAARRSKIRARAAGRVRCAAF